MKSFNLNSILKAINEDLNGLTGIEKNNMNLCRIPDYNHWLRHCLVT